MLHCCQAQARALPGQRRGEARGGKGGGEETVPIAPHPALCCSGHAEPVDNQKIISSSNVLLCRLDFKSVAAGGRMVCFVDENAFQISQKLQYK